MMTRTAIVLSSLLACGPCALAADQGLLGEYQWGQHDTAKQAAPRTASACAGYLSKLGANERAQGRLVISKTKFDGGGEGPWHGPVKLGKTGAGQTPFSIEAEGADDVMNLKGVIREVEKPYAVISITYKGFGEGGKDETYVFCRK